MSRSVWVCNPERSIPIINERYDRDHSHLDEEDGTRPLLHTSTQCISFQYYETRPTKLDQMFIAGGRSLTVHRSMVLLT